MKLYKLYLKIIRYSFLYAYKIIFAYILFLLLSVPFVTNRNMDVSDVQKVSVAFINEDEDSSLIHDMYAYLSEYCDFKTVDADKNSILDALYFENVQCVLKIPNGFTEQFQDGEQAKLVVQTVDAKNTDVIVTQAANRYLDAVEQESRHTGTSLDVASDSAVEKLTRRNKFSVYASNVTDKSQLTYFFNLLGYVVLSITIIVIGSSNIRLREGKVFARVKAAPISIRIFRLRIYFASVTFAFLLTSILVLLGFLMFERETPDVSSLFMIFNSYIFCLSAVSIAVLIGISLKSMKFFPPILNITTLTICFLSGAILQKQNMSPFIQKISSLLPVYWYVKNNIEINSISTVGMEQYRQFFLQIGIQILYAMVILVIACIIDEKKVNLEG